ncbi:hypothetical protein B0H19DRAFT_1111679 [Mycena capillaripes]|nr:hypothetical protein B0H19DRAFT_1201725 [Mycena capillaripes]KAJ6586174.1 hypothetical protein B0H19DRAFT_1111679 [Mycena capillaripes]
MLATLRNHEAPLARQLLLDTRDGFKKKVTSTDSSEDPPAKCAYFMSSFDSRSARTLVIC